MDLWEIILLAVGLAMDAFAVSISKGLSVRKVRVGQALTVGAYFGGFQAAMPLIGYFLGIHFQQLITGIDHWIAFVLLALIGINMIKESRQVGEQLQPSFGIRDMVPLAVATSIDALAVGITISFLPGSNIWLSIAFIGIITFAISTGGMYIGNLFGRRFKSHAELAGGIILILMGLKILLEHLGVIL